MESLDDILKRRLQTIVSEKGFDNTPKQARQLITHGHIGIDGRKFFVPSALITREVEPKISYCGKFSLKKSAPVKVGESDAKKD